eukprot:231787_1
MSQREFNSPQPQPHNDTTVMVACCNIQCNETIIIKNRDDFNSMKDYLNRSIYHYQPGQRRGDDPELTHIVFGIRVRIFCCWCSIRLSQCRLGYSDSQHARCQNYDCKAVCLKHKCFACNSIWMDKFYLCSSSCDSVCCYNCYTNRKYRKKEKICDICCIKRDINKIAAVLHNIYGDKYQAIYYEIAQYSYGRLINCCNDKNKCTNTIAINTKWDLYKLSEMYYHGSYATLCSGYKVPKSALVKNTVNLWGVKWRIFCHYCRNNNKLKRCDVCSKSESNIKCYPNKKIRRYFYGDADQPVQICELHPCCSLCNEQSTYNLITCSYCQCNFCVDCGVTEDKLCRNCCVWEEHELIYNALYESLYKSNLMTVENILGIIAWYSIGYVLSCCNFDYCDAEISIINKYEFYQNCYGTEGRGRILTKGKYGWYSVEKTNYFDTRHETHWYIYNKEIRIFCRYCSDNCCVNCKVDFCGNQELYYRFCRNHVKFCELCGVYAISRTMFLTCSFKFCNIELCGKCIGPHQEKHRKKQYWSQLKKCGLTKYDNDTVYKKICKPYSVV